MAENSAIGWTHHTFNPWIGCVKVSEGCRNCYAETLVKNRMGRPYLWGPKATAQRQVTTPTNWRKPLAWNKAAEAAGVADRVFTASLADVFEDHPTADVMRPRLFDMMAHTPFLHWLILTKRPERIRESLPRDWRDGYPNVWLGTSIESMDVSERADILREIPAVVRFISYEPALGPLDELSLERIDWVIYGGESGPRFRPHDLAWPRAMRARCADAGVAFFYKQSAARLSESGIYLDGAIVREYPTPRSMGPRYWLRPEIRSAYQARIEADLREPVLDERAEVRAHLPPKWSREVNP